MATIQSSDCGRETDSPILISVNIIKIEVTGIKKKESDKISAYIKQLMLSSDLKETAHLCDNEMLSAILCRYKRQCEKASSMNQKKDFSCWSL